VPPELGKIESISGLEFDDDGARGGGGEPRIAFVARRGVRGQAGRLARQGVIDRPDIEIADRVGRIEREAPASRDDAGQVVEAVVVAGDAAGVAQPQARPGQGRQELHRIVGGESRRVVVGGQRTHIDARQAWVGGGLPDPLQRLSQGQGHTLEVEAVRTVAIVIAARDRRRADERLAALARIEPGEMGRQGLPPLPARLDRGPMATEARQQDRLAIGCHRLGEFGRSGVPDRGRVDPAQVRRGLVVHPAILSFRSLARLDTCLSEPVMA
jgi:hypothetical protein